MIKQVKQLYYLSGVSFTLGLLSSKHAFATELGAQTITDNIVQSISNLPKLISTIGFLGGLTFATLGVLKIKDHVENPQQAPLKEGAIRLTIGGALVSMPAIYSALEGIFGSGANPLYVGLANLSF